LHLGATCPAQLPLQYVNGWKCPTGAGFQPVGSAEKGGPTGVSESFPQFRIEYLPAMTKNEQLFERAQRTIPGGVPDGTRGHAPLFIPQIGLNGPSCHD
jgi:hypothetical protein